MLITPSQCQCARILLKWSQSDLARHCGLHVQTICLFETETSTPTRRTLSKITMALEGAGIKFLPNDGVKRRVSQVQSLRGKEGFAKFRLNVLEEAKIRPLDCYVSNVDERQFDKWDKAEIRDLYFKTMEKLISRKKHRRSRFFVKEGDRHFPGENFSEYRWIPEREFGDFPLYIYGDKTAFLVFEEDDVHIFIISHPLITKFYRHEMDKKWEKAETF